jgi:catechol 2,3-dioxygenase-like lactoylglutathione lyase family enzyme
MKTKLVFVRLFVLTLVGVATTSGLPPKSNMQSDRNQTPVLATTCLITSDVKRLTTFYQHVLDTKPNVASENYVEFRTGAGILAIFAVQAQERYIPGSAKAGQNNSAILEFRVGDVDAQYAALHNFVKTWVKPPTNQPWGTRSIYFRDPDGNLIDFFAPIGTGSPPSIDSPQRKQR